MPSGRDFPFTPPAPDGGFVSPVVTFGEIDPGAIGANRFWFIVSTGRLKVRNAANTAWVDVTAATGTIPSAASTVTGPPAFGAAAVVGVGTAYARNDHIHGLPAAPPLAFDSVQVTPADIAIPNGSWGDILSLTLAAGTWLVGFTGTILCGASTGNFYVGIFDGAAVVADIGVTTPAATSYYTAAVVAPPIVLAAPTTVKTQAQANAASMVVTTVAGALGPLSSTMYAVRLA